MALSLTKRISTLALCAATSALAVACGDSETRET